jgi:hypothetical protein
MEDIFAIFSVEAAALLSAVPYARFTERSMSSETEGEISVKKVWEVKAEPKTLC